MDLESGNHVPDRNHIIPRKVDVKSVYTFGSPRVGDGVFAEIYAERLGFKTYRLTHGRDVVPSVPSTLLGFRHVPTRCTKTEMETSPSAMEAANGKAVKTTFGDVTV